MGANDDVEVVEMGAHKIVKTWVSCKRVSAGQEKERKQEKRQSSPLSSILASRNEIVRNRSACVRTGHSFVSSCTLFP
jgi:hypothetical protein